MKVSLDELLRLATQKGASDLHLKAGIIPVIRKHGSLRALGGNTAPLTPEELQEMAFGLLDEKQKEHFLDKKDIDLSYGLTGVGRFRINILFQRGTIRMVIRYIPDRVRSLDELQMPETIKKLADIERGLILVTGATGSGKSSTLAGIIDHINRNHSKHILMIEDPTEYLIRDKKCIITQRELGTDTKSFSESLRAALRQDPDVILIGEMRDRETIEIALQAAETGHLVLSTLHTLDAQETINRVLSCFEPHQQLHIRLQMASVLKAVVSQRLCAKKDGSGFTPALEILVNNPRIAEMISIPERTIEIRKAMEEGSAWGMTTFDQTLMDLVAKEIITYDEALKSSTSPENFAIRYSGVSQMDGKKWGEVTQFKKRLEQQWQDLTAMDMEKTKNTRTGTDDETKPGKPPGLFKKFKK